MIFGDLIVMGCMGGVEGYGRVWGNGGEDVGEMGGGGVGG